MDKGVSIPVSETNTPAWCITQCAKSDPTKRYASKSFHSLSKLD